MPVQPVPIFKNSPAKKVFGHITVLVTALWPPNIGKPDPMYLVKSYHSCHKKNFAALIYPYKPLRYFWTCVKLNRL